MAKSNTWLRKLGKWTKKTFGSLWNKVTGSDLTNAERATMNYNAEQAQINRDFQSAEADRARQWQEDYYQQYESPQAKIRQYEEAGLNPALMYGGATSSGSAPSTSVPSGSSATTGMPQNGESLLSFIGQMMSMKSVISKNNAEANKANADAENTKQSTEWQPRMWEDQLKTNEVNRQNTLAGVELLQRQCAQIVKNMELTDAQIGEVISKTSNIEIDTAKKALERDGVEINNALLAKKILQTSAETRLTNAQTLLTKNQSDKVHWESFIGELDAYQAQTSGGSRATSWAGLVDKGASVVADNLSSLWKSIFGKKNK